MVAIIAGDVDKTHRLLSNGADVNSKGAKMTLIHDGREFKLRSCPLLWAIVQCDAAIVKVLLEAGADPTMSTAFFTHAVKSGDEVILRDLLEAVAGESGILGGDFHIHGSFLQAARSAPHLLNILVQYGADINSIDSEGDTDLMKALRGKVSFCVVERLLAFGANVNLSNSRTGITPLILAITCNSPQTVIELLLEKGADPHCKDRKGQNALYCAAKRYNVWALSRLLQENVNLEYKFIK